MKNPSRLRILCKDNHGGSLIELALVIPILLLLVLGAVDFGHAYYVYLEVVNAAHAGAEYGSLHPTDTSGITTAATQKQSDTGVAWNPPVPTYGCECSDGTSYTANCSLALACTANATRSATTVHRVQVTTSAIYSTFVHWPGIPSTITLSTTATVRGY
jgi:Flp pilus assembly protein TadG